MTYHCPQCNKFTFKYQSENDSHVIYECSGCTDVYCQAKTDVNPRTPAYFMSAKEYKEKQEVQRAEAPQPKIVSITVKPKTKEEAMIPAPKVEVNVSQKRTRNVAFAENVEVIPEKTKAVKEEKPKKRTKKDPKAPKKPITSYMYYCSEARGKFKTQNPSAGFGAITSLCAASWKKITKEGKAPYEELARIDKLRYAKEKEAYIQSKDFPEVPSVEVSDETIEIQQTQEIVDQ